MAFNPIRAFAARPRLLAAILFGAAVSLALHFTPGGISWSTQSILSWDAGCLWFVISMLHGMWRQSPEAMAERSARQDEGQGLILTLVLIASIASIGAVAVELSVAKNLHGFAKTLRIVLAFATLAISWFLVQLIFALHYAHEYYSDCEVGEPGVIEGGLAFPAGELPDYWDLLHFAMVIGVAAQTADIGFVSKKLRRIGTIHGVIAFTFNTVVLALGINLMAGLF